ncbi:MAG: hypothetical protein ACFFEX_18235 [Candidatus Thorarchaeota archaeon]
MKVNRVLGLVFVFFTLTFMTATPAAASGYTYSSKYIMAYDNRYPSSDPAWMVLRVSGHWRESGYGSIYFYDAKQEFFVTDLPPHYRIEDVVLRGITDSYDTTKTADQMNLDDILIIARGNIRSDGIMVILDCDVVIPIWKLGWVWIFYTWYVHHYETVHAHVILSIDISDTNVGWQPALYIGPKLT